MPPATPLVCLQFMFVAKQSFLQAPTYEKLPARGLSGRES